MNQGVNGSMTHGLIDGAGSSHPGPVPWVGGGRGSGIPREGGKAPRCWRRGVGGGHPRTPEPFFIEKSLSKEYLYSERYEKSLSHLYP